MEYKVFLCPCKDGNVCNLVVHHHFSLLRKWYGNRGLHDRAWIWILSSSVKLVISRVSAANEWDVVEPDREKIKFISTNGHVIFCLLHKHTNADVFDDFPKISDHFPKISKDFQNCSERTTNVSEHFPKITEDLWS